MHKKIAVLVDGFNLYHAIKAFQRKIEKTERKPYNHYNYLKWLNLRKLASLFIQKNEELYDIYYFTAYAHWLKDDSKSNSLSRHQDYVKFLESLGIKIVLGKFKKTTKKCRKCEEKYNTYEEKETDVNISVISMVLLCEDKIDKIMIVSADSDLIPPAKQWQQQGKEVSFLVPPVLKSVTKDIKQKFHYQLIKKRHIVNSLLPESIKYDGKTVIRPSEYNPPE